MEPTKDGLSKPTENCMSRDDYRGKKEGLGLHAVSYEKSGTKAQSISSGTQIVTRLVLRRYRIDNQTADIKIARERCIYETVT